MIDTADVVFHKPSGERWVVAFVRGEYLAWCGWPQGEAKLFDCELVKKATSEARDKLLTEMANMNDQSDPRCRYAIAEFQRREDFGPNGDATTPGFFKAEPAPQKEKP